jgi:hypothetical protein
LVSHTEVEHRLRVYKKRVLRGVANPYRDEVTGECRRLHNEELYDVFSPNIFERSEKNKMDGACSTYEGEERCIQSFGGAT